MLKTVFIFLLGLLCYQYATAQKADSVLVNMKFSNEMVESKDNADYFLLIMTPPDSSTGVKINKIKEYNKDKKLILTGTAQIYIQGNRLFLIMVGTTSEYFETG